MGLVDFAIRRRVTIAMATVAITLLGFISLSRLKVNLLPDLSYPTLTIRTELPGAAPTEIENLISRPVEEAAGVVRNVRSVRSVSRSGQSDVIVEFSWGTDLIRIELEPTESGCTFTLLDTIEEVGKAARDSAGWHMCVDALENSLNGTDAGPIDWRVLNKEYQDKFGPEASTIGPPPGM